MDYAVNRQPLRQTIAKMIAVTLLATIALCTHYVYINIHEVFDYNNWLNEVKDVNRQWEPHVMDNAVSINKDQLSETISHLN